MICLSSWIDWPWLEMEVENSHVDVQHLIGEVAARHGILLKPDDAAFALVTINQLMLEQIMTDLLAKMQGAVGDFEQAAVRVQTRAGTVLAGEVKEAAAKIRHEMQTDIAAAGKQARDFVFAVHRSNSQSARAKWLALGVVCAVGFFLCGILVGRILP